MVFPGLPRGMGKCVGLGGTLGEEDPLWPGPGEVVECASPCQAK